MTNSKGGMNCIIAEKGKASSPGALPSSQLCFLWGKEGAGDVGKTTRPHSRVPSLPLPLALSSLLLTLPQSFPNEEAVSMTPNP